MDDSLTATVTLEGAADSDAEELDELTMSLREELLAQGVDDARRSALGAAPHGTKAGEMFQLGALVVALSPVALQGVIDGVRQWEAGRSVRKVTITVAGDSLTLERATQAEQDQLVKAFLDKHGDQG